MLSVADREVVYEAVRRVKARTGETTTADALVLIVKEWMS